MAFPSVTYTFSNATPSDATQVNQNFTDLVNGLSDGTKNINITSATLSGTISVTGAATLTSATLSTSLSVGTTLAVTGVATLTAAPVFSSVTASQFLLVDGGKALTSVAGTGSGSVVRATSPTITTPTFSGTIASGLTASRTVITDGSGNFAINTETGTGSHVRASTPTLVTPVLGAATATSINFGGTSLANYDEGTFTCTITGCTTSPTGTASYVRIGKQVTLILPSITATSNTTALTYTGLPAAIRPVTNQMVMIPLAMDNSASAYNRTALIDNVTAITFFNNGSAWTSSGSKGLPSYPQAISYTLY